MFGPTKEPAKSIYNALVDEMTKRKHRSVDEWIEAERRVVLNSSAALSQTLGLHPPTLEQVMVAERCACGHVDYAAKFAYGVAETVRTDSLSRSTRDLSI